MIKKENLFYESNLLRLNSNKVYKYIKWKSVLNFDDTIELTINWYKNFYRQSKKNIYEIYKNDIYNYSKILEKKLNLK